eukprot:jgi/Psemu1/41135/gm1.41135_g
MEKTTVEALDEDKKKIRQQIIDRLDYGRRLISRSSIEAIALDTPIAIYPSKDRITSSPDLIFHVYTPRDTIFYSNNSCLTPFVNTTTDLSTPDPTADHQLTRLRPAIDSSLIRSHDKDAALDTPIAIQSFKTHQLTGSIFLCPTSLLPAEHEAGTRDSKHSNPEVLQPRPSCPQPTWHPTNRY